MRWCLGLKIFEIFMNFWKILQNPEMNHLLDADQILLNSKKGKNNAHDSIIDLRYYLIKEL